ncbi:MAG: hypothetical protein AAGC92_13805 [Pseudomonadota bacterium]
MQDKDKSESDIPTSGVASEGAREPDADGISKTVKSEDAVEDAVVVEDSAAAAPGPGDPSTGDEAAAVQEVAQDEAAAPTEEPSGARSQEILQSSEADGSQADGGQAWPESAEAEDPDRDEAAQAQELVADAAIAEAVAQTTPETVDETVAVAEPADEPAAEPADEPATEASQPALDVASEAAPATATVTATAAAAEPHPQPADGEEPHEEEYRRSLAGRVLTWLFFLVAGMALILWAGPRIAPHLPSGLEPVAVWLAPGTESAAERAAALEAVRTELIERIEALPEAAAPADVEVQIAALNEALRDAFSEADEAAVVDLRERIGLLSDQVAAEDSAVIEARLSAAETVLQGLTAELATLKSELAGVAENDGQLSEEASTRIAAFSATVEGLRSELAEVAGKLGAQAQRIDEVEAASRRREQEAAERASQVAAEAAERARIAALRESVADLGARIEAGTPFTAELDAVAALLNDPVPDALAVTAEDGVPTLKELLDSFAPPAHAAIRASIRSDPGEGVVDRATAFLEARVATRSLEEQAGDSTDAVLSRVEARLRDDRPSEALVEAQALPPEAQPAMAGWLLRLGLRASALDAYAALRAAVDTSN